MTTALVQTHYVTVYAYISNNLELYTCAIAISTWYNDIYINCYYIYMTLSLIKNTFSVYFESLVCLLIRFLKTHMWSMIVGI